MFSVNTVLPANPVLRMTTLNKLFFWSIALFAVALVVMVPELAFAEGGEAGYWGKGASDIAERSERSFQDWWEVGSTWLLWIGLGVLITSVLVFKGTGWWIALVVWALAAWGDKMVEWFGAL